MPRPGHVHADASKLEIPDDEELYRLIHPINYSLDKNNVRRVRSGAFKTEKLSCLRLRLFSIQEALQANPKHGAGVFTAGFVRSTLKCIICVEDEDEFPAGGHVVIFQDVTGKPLSNWQCKRLAAEADSNLRAIPVT